MFWYHRVWPHTHYTRYEYKLANIYRKLTRSFQSSKECKFSSSKKPFSNPTLEVQPNLDQMAQKVRGKEEKKERGEKEKKRSKKLGTKSKEKKKKKKKKERNPCASFSSAHSSFFWSIRNTLFREKHTISAFGSMQDFFDEQIIWILRAKNPLPTPFFAILPKSSGGPKNIASLYCVIEQKWLWREWCADAQAPIHEPWLFAYMGQVMRKGVLCHMRTTKVQISLRIRAVWTTPLLITV